MDKNIIDDIRKNTKKIAKWIPIKKYRRYIRNEIPRKFELVANSNEKLERFAQLVTPTNDRELQKQILKRNVRLVEAESASFCNRKCWFCPNSFIDRYSQNIELNENVWLKIIDNLAEIDYDGLVAFNRYSEPLANRDLILRRIKQARQKLPNATLFIITNGDYLDREYLDSLRNVGTDSVYISYYLGKNQEFDAKNIIKPGMQKLIDKLGLEYTEIRNDDYMYQIKFSYDICVYYQAWNPDYAKDRAGSLSDERIAKVKRDFFCDSPLCEISVDYNGFVMPCCNMRSEIDEHKDFILGDLNKNDLFEIFMNDKFIKTRKDLMSNTPKYKPCEYCTAQRGMF